MAKGIFIIGTDTGVGKTVVSAALVSRLRWDGECAGYFKPVLSGAGFKDGSLIPGDALFVKALSGLTEDNSNLAPCLFPNPVSPHLAAEMVGRSVEIEVIKEKYHDLNDKYDYLVVEGCGGLAVPLTRDGYMLYDLVKELDLGCLVVAGAALGTINHTLLTVRYGQSLNIRVKGIIINGYTGGICEDDNIRMIEKLAGLPIIAVIPKIQGVDVERLQFGAIREELQDRNLLADIREWLERWAS